METCELHLIYIFYSSASLLCPYRFASVVQAEIKRGPKRLQCHVIVKIIII